MPIGITIASPMRRLGALLLEWVPLAIAFFLVGFTAALASGVVGGAMERAKQVKAQADIAELKTALDRFYLDHGSYPKSDQGLNALVAGGYVANIPSDPWGDPYQYQSDGNNYELGSTGLGGNEATDSGAAGHLFAAVGLLLTSVVLLGYLIWALFLFSRGQSPGKFLIGIRIVKLNEARAAGLGTCFLREWIAKPVIAVLSVITLGIVNFWLVWDKDTQELWDKVVGTIVVNDSKGLTIPVR